MAYRCSLMRREESPGNKGQCTSRNRGCLGRNTSATERVAENNHQDFSLGQGEKVRKELTRSDGNIRLVQTLHVVIPSKL